MTRRPCRILVAGAGPVGLLFALRLALGGRQGESRIRVVDAGEPRRWQQASVDPRVYALSRESQWLLADLWPAIVSRRVSPYRRMRVFEGDSGDSAAAVDFDAADIGEPDLGHIVEDSLLRTVLLERLASLEVETAFGSGVESLERRGETTCVLLDDGSELTADLVVGADGTGSRVRAAAGIETVGKSYGQRAVVAHVASALPHRATAWQRFLPEGPLAFLPLADGRSSIVWTLSEAGADRVLGLADAAFLAALEEASAGVLGALGPASGRLAFGLELKHAVAYTRPGVALIGDAAHAVHPLAGQGMNLGLGDAAVLADTLLAALAAGEHPADARILSRYARAQRGHNLTMQLAFDGLNALFSRQRPAWLAPLRGLGMAAVDRLGPVRRELMRRALGLDRARPPGV